MSYSVCLVCTKMVSGYEKYCCSCGIHFRQDLNFWKTRNYSDVDKDQELIKDKINIPYADNDFRFTDEEKKKDVQKEK